MKMYEVEVFNSINESKDYTEVNFYQNKFIVKESDLESLKEKGEGFARLRYIGDLYTPDNKNDGIIVNVSCNLVGKEDVEETIKELEDKLKSLRVSLTV
jgi:prefoldin subunit 5